MASRSWKYKGFRPAHTFLGFVDLNTTALERLSTGGRDLKCCDGLQFYLAGASGRPIGGTDVVRAGGDRQIFDLT